MNGLSVPNVRDVVLASPAKSLEKLTAFPTAMTWTLNEAMGLNPSKVGLVHEMLSDAIVCPVTCRLVGGLGGTGISRVEREEGKSKGRE